jgi:hypothetical protein
MTRDRIASASGRATTPWIATALLATAFASTGLSTGADARNPAQAPDVRSAAAQPSESRWIATWGTSQLVPEGENALPADTRTI